MLAKLKWNPGKGVKGAFRLLGRHGKYHPNLRLADFRHQQGIYILYGDHGAHYVGLTKKLGLGKRLGNHRTDQHAGKWHSFSWFGFCAVQKATDKNGLHKLGQMAQVVLGSPSFVITDIEAVLIRAMNLKNNNKARFKNAEEWFQVEADKTESYLHKIA